MACDTRCAFTESECHYPEFVAAKFGPNERGIVTNWRICIPISEGTMNMPLENLLLE